MISVIIISKDEEGLDQTLGEVSNQVRALNKPIEILVVDASEGRLDHIRKRHQAMVTWINFDRPPGVAISIPHQRNAGVQAASGDVIVFTDAGCKPESEWLTALLKPLRQDDSVVVGITRAPSDGKGLYDGAVRLAGPEYVAECSTINLAFRRAAYEKVGGFDESFSYGSDVDFSWRLIDAGYRIRCVPDAVVRHDWGTWGRQVRRSYLYGRARTRLYRKHRSRLKGVLRQDPMVVAYPLFLLGLPVTLIFPLYPTVLIIPAWRNRSRGAFRVVADHLVFGFGVLREVLKP